MFFRGWHGSGHNFRYTAPNVDIISEYGRQDPELTVSFQRLKHGRNGNERCVSSFSRFLWLVQPQRKFAGAARKAASIIPTAACI